MLVAWPVLKCLQTTNKPVAEVFTDSWSNAWDVWAARLSLTRGAPPRGDLLPKRCHTRRGVPVERTEHLPNNNTVRRRSFAKREHP